MTEWFVDCSGSGSAADEDGVGIEGIWNCFGSMVTLLVQLCVL